MHRNAHLQCETRARLRRWFRFFAALASMCAIWLSSQRSVALAGSHRHKTFEWMEWAPPADSQLQANLDSYFPHALPDGAVIPSIRRFLKPLGILPENTIYGESVCSDEINHKRESLTALMSRYWASGVFPLGGIGGAPFVGRTGFGAFAGHVPHEGNVFILFGPHVGMTPDGEVGLFVRSGQPHASNTCGALVGGYNMVSAGKTIPLDDLADVEEAWICAKLSTYIPEIKASDNPMVSLVKRAYEVIEDEVLKIVNTKFGSGNLVLLGGIQINLPDPHQDHFQPLHFSVRSAKGAPTDLMHAFD